MSWPNKKRRETHLMTKIPQALPLSQLMKTKPAQPFPNVLSVKLKNWPLSWAPDKRTRFLGPLINGPPLFNAFFSSIIKGYLLSGRDLITHPQGEGLSVNKINLIWRD